jgi:plastocyanin
MLDMQEAAGSNPARPTTDSVDERVSNGTFDESLAVRGATVERVFDSPGTFAYFCQPHSAFMFALVTVP